MTHSSQKPSSNPGYFRPPGAMNERDFVNVCLRCQRCVGVCPTKSIRPLSLMKGLWAAWTPAIKVNSGGYCIRCLNCVKTCASGALQKINRNQIKIGIAVIDETKCLDWTVGGCSKCINTCPLVKEGKIAIKMIEGKPVVQEDTCVGCAVCTIQCPVDAITISPYKREMEEKKSPMKSDKVVVYRKHIALMVLLALLSFVVFQWLAANWVIALLITFFLIPCFILTVALGRFFCGWICPFGSRIRANKKSKYGKTFCSFLCPVGLILSPFNKISLIKLHRDIEKCTPTMCPIKNACMRECPMGCDVLDKRFKDLKCVRCFTCIQACTVGALRGRWLWQK